MASKRRLMRLSSNPSVFSPRGLDRVASLRRLGRLNLLALFALVVGVVLFLYLATGNRLALVLAVALTAVGVDGLMRTNPAVRLRGIRDTAFFVFVPVLFTLGAGVFFRYTVEGFWALPAAIVSAVALGAIVHAEYRSAEAAGEQLLTLRLILNLAAYLSAFAHYTALYNQRLPLLVASLLVGAVSMLISLDVLRELELEPRLLVIYSATLGFIMLEARWALNFISLTGWLGGVFILIVFYVASQVLHTYLSGRMERRAVLEYGVVGTIGVLLVVLGRVLSQG
jgi:hypothetical protein